MRWKHLSGNIHQCRKTNKNCFCVFAAAGGQWEESEELNSTAGFYSLTGLQPGTEYRLMIIHGNTTYWQDSASTVGTGICLFDLIFKH